MAGKFELSTSKDGQFMWNLKAGNGQIILTSERYKAKASALNGVESVRKNSQDDARFDRRESKKGEPYFVLTATNGEIIGRSEMYSSNSAMENGIDSVRRHAVEAKLVEETEA
ncbi:MAG: YegP family protein [Planctomycetes bacterium]|nr:YegP family protein [Planctomycetota bacterium]